MDAQFFEGLFVIIYLIVGYWAVGQTLWANKVIYGTGEAIFTKRLCLGFGLGWILIPIALIKKIVGKKKQ